MTGGHRTLSRRRALAVIGAAAGLTLGGSRAALPERFVHEWRGQALGAEARLLLVHPERRVVEGVVARCQDEIFRLERIFSLHRPDSELAELNRAGRLRAASHDLRRVLAEAERIAGLSGGAFDVTIQPLWQLYAGHFQRRPDDAAGPDARALDAVRPLIDYRRVVLEAGGVALERPGMALTLNGIAQGYITDRIIDLLRASGFPQVLVQLGETRALAPPQGRSAWRVGVLDPDRPTIVVETFDLADRALATSAGSATAFDRAGRHHHLLEPRSGTSAHRWRSVSVLAERATTADALSTALAIMPLEPGAALLRTARGAEALYLLPDGRRRRVSA